FRAKQGTGPSSLLSTGSREEARLPCGRGNQVRRVGRHVRARPDLAPVGVSKPQANPPRTRGTVLDRVARVVGEFNGAENGQSRTRGVFEAPRHPSTRQVGSAAASSGWDFVCKSGSGIRWPSRRKPAAVSASVRAPPHQTAAGDVASSVPPTAGPRATPAVKLRP